MQGAAVLAKQTSEQPPADLQHQRSQEQPSVADPQGTHGLCFTTLPQESRQDNSLAAYQSLLSEEAGRMLLHASADGALYPARSLLRTPHHLLPLIEACKTLQGLKSLDLSSNALSDAQLPQLQHLMEAGVRLTSLDLSHNQFSSQAAAPLCSIISHVSHPVLPHGPSQASAQSLPLQAADNSESAAQAFVESASQNLDSAARDLISLDIPSAASTASAGLQSDSVAGSAAAEGFTREGGSSSRSAGEASTSESDTPSGVSHDCFCVQRLFQSLFPAYDCLKGLKLMAPCNMCLATTWPKITHAVCLYKSSIAYNSMYCMFHKNAHCWLPQTELLSHRVLLQVPP